MIATVRHRTGWNGFTKRARVFMSSSTSICGRRLTVVLLVGLSGCTVHPPGEFEERATAAQMGKPFEKPIEVRQIPPLPATPTSGQLVEYALLNNAELEQHYWEWQSAIEQIPQDGTQTTTLNVAAGTNITNGHTSWGSSSVTLGNDPMTDIKWPGKLDAAAKQTLENARATGRRFIKAKYDLRYKVLRAYYDYALNAELIRLEQGNQRLLRTIATLAETRNRAGRSGQQDVLKSSNEADVSGNDVANMRSQLPSQRAAINALLSRPADAPLPVPTKLPASRRIVYGAGDLVEMAARQNPELVALADEIRGRGEGIRLAELQYVSDFNLSLGTDLMGVTQSLLSQATIPIFRYEALNAAIAQAEAKLRASEAMRRQIGNNLTAQVIADIAIIRDAGRQLDLFDHTILPRAREVVNVARTAFETGDASETDAAPLLNLLDNQRSLIAIERLAAKVRITQATYLAELESIATSYLTSPPHTDRRAAAQ
jgi:outer membrane protein, heavy metal efflux system